VPPFTILPAGDAAIVVQLPERIDPALNAWCVSLARRLHEQLGSSIRDAVVGYSSVTVYFDPLHVDAAWIDDEVRDVAEALDLDEEARDRPILDVPVRYGGEYGPDLESVAAFAACSGDEVVEMHAAREYRVYLVGFIPGFAYMAEVDPRIAAPRRATPRTAVQAGSVAIAGGQTGVYPAVTPGGWNIIGRTALAPYDAARAEPCLFQPGDRVRFRPVGSV